MSGAGKPVCNCKVQDTCLCTIDVNSNIGSKTYTYEKKSSLPTIFAHDKNGEGAKIKITITPKGCTSKNSSCPSGVLYRDGEHNVDYQLFHSNLEECNLKYIDLVGTKGAKVDLSNKYNIVAIIVMILKDMNKDIRHTKYNLAVYECHGKALSNNNFFLKNSKLSLGQYRSSFSNILVYPKYSVKIGVMLGLESAISNLTNVERKDLMLAYKRDTFNYNNHHGWQDKTSKTSIIRSLTITGFSEYTCGNILLKSDSNKIKKEFIQYKEKLSLLNQIDKAFDVTKKLFTSTKDKKDPYPLTDMKFISPNLVISGEAVLDSNKSTDKPYIKGKFDLAFKPLLGVQLTIDLIQAFATYYGLQYIVGSIREVAASGEEQVKNGKNGAYLKGNFDLIVKGTIDIGFSIFSNEKFQLSYQFLDKTEAKLAITAEAKIEAGGKVYFINGYFEAGGKVTAEGCCGLQSRKESGNIKGGLDLIFYHNGIVATFWAEAGFGEKGRSSANPTTTSTNSDGKLTDQTRTNTTNNSNLKGKVLHTWEIAEKLTKAKSTYKISIT